MKSIEDIIHVRPDEEVVLVVRRYILTFIWKFILSFLFFLLPFFLFFFLVRYGTIGMSIFGFLLFSAIIYAIHVGCQWYYTVFVVTNLRIVDIFQKGIFDRAVSEQGHDYITDVSYKLDGLFETTFGFGDIFIQSWGPTLKLPSIYKPDLVQQKLIKIIAAFNAKIKEQQQKEKDRELNRKKKPEPEVEKKEE